MYEILKLQILMYTLYECDVMLQKEMHGAKSPNSFQAYINQTEISCITLMQYIISISQL